jgi:hypothetical protein
VALYIGKRKTSSPQGVRIPLSWLKWVQKMGYAEGSSALDWLREAIYLSAPITHPEGNRRYGDLLLTVESNRLEQLSYYEPLCAECGDTRKFIVYEGCFGCDGKCEIAFCRKAKRQEWPCQHCAAIDKREPFRQNGGMNKRKSRR